MIGCTFFGHKDAPYEIADKLRLALIDLIENKKVDTFYVGNHGNFDRMVYQTLYLLKQRYPHICYTVVLAYHPSEQSLCYFDYKTESLLPDGIEQAPPRFAISKRNCWMIDHATFVLAYVKAAGGAKQYKELAERKGRIVINLAD